MEWPLIFGWYFFWNYLRHILHKYANEDVSLGSWLIGLDVEHVDDRRLCCGTPPGNLKFYFAVLFTFPFFSFSHHVFLFE
jgi:hypothetical protein